MNRLLLNQGKKNSKHPNSDISTLVQKELVNNIGTGQKEQLPELSHTDYSIGLKLLGL